MNSPSKLSADERLVLGTLIVPESSPITDQTVSVVSSRTGLSEQEVTRLLGGLEERDPPLVRRETDAKLQVEVWFVLVDAVEELEGPAAGWGGRLRDTLRPPGSDGSPSSAS